MKNNRCKVDEHSSRNHGVEGDIPQFHSICFYWWFPHEQMAIQCNPHSCCNETACMNVGKCPRLHWQLKIDEMKSKCPDAKQFEHFRCTEIVPCQRDRAGQCGKLPGIISILHYFWSIFSPNLYVGNLRISDLDFSATQFNLGIQLCAWYPISKTYSFCAVVFLFSKSGERWESARAGTSVTVTVRGGMFKEVLMLDWRHELALTRVGIYLSLLRIIYPLRQVTVQNSDEPASFVPKGVFPRPTNADGRHDRGHVCVHPWRRRSCEGKRPRSNPRWLLSPASPNPLTKRPRLWNSAGSCSTIP